MIRRILTIGALVAAVIPGGWLAVLLAGLLATAPLLVVVQRFNGAYPSAFTRLFVFRPFWYVQLATPLLALSGAIGFLACAPFGFAASGGRRALVIVASVFVALAMGGYLGSRVLRVKELEARSSGLPPALEGMRIVQLSDLHVGPHTSRRFLARVLRTVQNLRPDQLSIPHMGWSLASLFLEHARERTAAASRCCISARARTAGVCRFASARCRK